MLQEELEGSKGFALQGAQRSQKKKVKKSCFCLPQSCSQRPFHRDASTECSCAPYTTAPGRDISPHLLQEKGELGSSAIATLPWPLGQAPGAGIPHRAATAAQPRPSGTLA